MPEDSNVDNLKTSCFTICFLQVWRPKGAVIGGKDGKTVYADIDVRETTGFVIMTECDVVMKMTSAVVTTNPCPGSTSISFSLVYFLLLRM